MYNEKVLDKKLKIDFSKEALVAHEEVVNHFEEMGKRRQARYASWCGWFWKAHDWCWYSFWAVVRFEPLKELKYFWQRGTRGWSDRDAWGTYHYLSKIISEMTADLSQPAKPGYVQGHPCNLKSIKEWHSILKKISKAFKLRYEKDLYSAHLWKHDSQLAKDADVMTLEEDKQMKEGFKLFNKWFHNLWD